MWALKLNYRDAGYSIDKKLLKSRYETLCKNYEGVKLNSPQTAEIYKTLLDQAYNILEDNYKRTVYIVLISKP